MTATHRNRLILDDLVDHASRRPEAPAFGVGQEAVSWSELLARTKRMAAGLAAKGLGPGHRCALVLPTSLDLVVGILASQWTGAAPVVLDDKLPPGSLRKRLGLIRPRGILARPEAGSSLEEAMPGGGGFLEDPDALLRGGGAGSGFDHRAMWEAPAYLQLTSGTTGEPKGVVISHRALALHLPAMNRSMGIQVDDVCVTWVPLYHDYGLINFLFMPVHLGCASHLIPPAVANFPRWLKTINRLRGTVTGSPDFGYRMAARLVDPEGLDLSCLRVLGCGGEPVRASTLERFAARFGLSRPMTIGYGQAEATLCISLSNHRMPTRVDKAGNVSNGRPLPGMEVRIVDDAGERLGPEQTGRIHIRAPYLFDGYFDDPEATTASFDGEWLDTGDDGYLDGEGNLYVLGRRRAMIKRAGALVAPREVEEAAESIEGVRRAAAIGAPDAGGEFTEKIVVLVEIAPGKFPTTESRAAMAEQVAGEIERAMGYAPGDVVLVKPGSIELTHNGKLRYAAIRAAYLAGELEQTGRVIYPQTAGAASVDGGSS